MLKVGPFEAHLPTIALALALGAAGGWVALLLGLPLPWLIGSLTVTTVAALAGWTPTGRVLGLPMQFRLIAIPVIGVAIGASITAETVQQMPEWWPTLLALFAFIPAAHAMGFWLTSRFGGTDPVTTFYGTMPGGLLEALAMGDEAGADGAMLLLLQFLRLVLCIVFIPIGFTLATGEAVGSASGAVIGDDYTLRATDWGVLFLSGLLGALLGNRIGLPAGILTGPFIASAAVHLLGWAGGAPPGWLIDVTQLVVGTSLGARFAGRKPEILIRALRLAAVNVAAMLSLAALIALALADVVDQRWEAVLLAFAPGGVAEMALVALSLEISVIYVTVHHVMRIVLAVLVARLVVGRVM